MKHLVIKLSSFCIAAALAAFSVVSVFAQDSTDGDESAGELTVNGEAPVGVGDIFTYTLYLDETNDPIIGFEMRLFYDSDFLEYQKGSLKFDNFDVVIFNEDVEGRIPMYHTSVSNPSEFSSKKQFLTADFKVKKPGEASVTYFVTEMYGSDMTYLKNYKFTYDINSGDRSIIKDGIPPVNSDDDTLKNHQGDFIHYSDGMGENSPKAKTGNHEMVAGNLAADSENAVVDLTKPQNEKKEGGISGGMMFVFIGVPLLIAAVVVAVVIVSKKNKSEPDAEPEYAPAAAEKEASEEEIPQSDE